MSARIELVPIDLPATPTSPSAWPHFLRLVAANGRILAHSENYATRASARRAASTWVRAFRDVAEAPESEQVREVSE